MDVGIVLEPLEATNARRIVMKFIIIGMLVIAVVAVVVVPRWSDLSAPANAEVVEGEQLSLYMDHLRRLTHKLGLSIDAQNTDLASFYVDKITETVELIKANFPQYDGFQIGALITAMLSPNVAVLTQAIEGEDWDVAASGYDNLLKAGCNGCHAATQRPFVKIVRSKTNPYNQDFKP